MRPASVWWRRRQPNCSANSLEHGEFASSANPSCPQCCPRASYRANSNSHGLPVAGVAGHDLLRLAASMSDTDRLVRVSVIRSVGPHVGPIMKPH
jgi:transposase-like protein